jgi:hypothetical protein
VAWWRGLGARGLLRGAAAGKDIRLSVRPQNGGTRGARARARTVAHGVELRAAVAHARGVRGQLRETARRKRRRPLAKHAHDDAAERLSVDCTHAQMTHSTRK